MSWTRTKKLFWDNFGRAVAIALVVGTLLILINHGDHIREEPVCDHFFLKGLLCYVVPFTVSIVSAIFAGVERRTS